MDESAQRNALLRLSNSIDLESIESVGCAGAIVNFLSRRGISHRAARGERSLAILGIESFTIDSYMFINPNSLSSLQIFEDESHPSMHSSIRGRKEGLSLYGLLCSPVGELESKTINRPNFYMNATQFGYYCLKIYSYAQEILVGDSPIIQEILQQFAVKDLVEIGAFINDVLDFDESVIEGRCVVKHNVDEELDRMRHTYHGLDSFLSDIAKEISKTIPSDFTSTINVIYFPQLGYLITVPMNPNWKTDQDFYLEGLSYQSWMSISETYMD
ncbi:MutS protein msh5 [Mortierella sp. AD094]|nr:MutS protein msh5 [Mortierella sp. AD094]